MFLIFIRVGSVAARFKSAFLIAEKFQETHDFRELQSAVTFVLVKVSSKFKLFCAAFAELYQINFDLETFIEIKKTAGGSEKNTSVQSTACNSVERKRNRNVICIYVSKCRTMVNSV